MMMMFQEFYVLSVRPTFWVIALVTLSSSVVQLQGAPNHRPIIGILGMGISKSSLGDEFIQSTYVKFFESAGAQVVPVRGNQPECYYQHLFKNINGLLFPGGHNDPVYFRSARLLYDMAVKANQAGDYFPIWGTCKGFQVFFELEIGSNLLSPTDTENITLPLKFVKGFESSKLFKDMPAKFIGYLANENMTQHNHQYGLLLKTYHETLAPDFYQALSTNIGRDNKEFVSTMEAKDFPFYGTQWHPEKSMFLWRQDQVIDHSPHAVEVGQYMANFFVNEARKSQHHYQSPTEEAKAVIENFKRYYKVTYHNGPLYYFSYPTLKIDC